MLIEKPSGHRYRWHTWFAILPIYLGEENGMEITAWGEWYQWRYAKEHPHTGREHPYDDFVEYRPLNAGPNFVSHVHVPSYQ